MRASDFEYDGKMLSDFGMIICSFGDKGLDTISNGANISFNTAPIMGGSKHHLISTEYEDCLETTLQICKYSCTDGVREITAAEFRELTRWLNRKKFLKFKILDEDYIDLYFEASFNISRIEINGKLIGVELKVITNRPFALKETKVINIQNTVESGHITEMYGWKKYAINNVIKETSYARAMLSTQTNNVWNYIEYAEDFNVIDGKISLVNAVKIEGSASAMMGVIEGKYVCPYISNIYDSMHECYRIPSDATIFEEGEKSFRVSYVSPAYGFNASDVEVDKEFIENIYSEDENAYPHDGIKGEYYYVFIGKPFVPKKTHSINDISYEEGYIYPHTEITIINDGDLNIYNAIEDRNTYIANCVAGEVIVMDYPIIRSSISSHNIQNDFNWNFFRVANTYDNSRNDLTISLPCSIKIKYSPIVKVGL